LLILDTKDVASPGNAEIITNHLSKGYAAFESYLEILEHADSVHQSRQRKALYHNKGEGTETRLPAVLNLSSALESVILDSIHMKLGFGLPAWTGQPC